MKFVEEYFRAENFGGNATTGRSLEMTGASFYEYDLEKRVITAGGIHFDFENFLNLLRTSAHN